MGFVQETDVRKMLEDKTLVNNIVKAMVQDPTVLSGLAEDVADELEELLEGDPSFRQKIVAAATTDPKFKSQVIRNVVKEITD